MATVDTVTTIRADEISHVEAPQLIAMVYRSEFSQTVLSTTGIDTAEVESGLSGVVLALVISFVAVVTVSRRSQEAD